MYSCYAHDMKGVKQEKALVVAKLQKFAYLIRH
jgi:hypothetical protein